MVYLFGMVTPCQTRCWDILTEVALLFFACLGETVLTCLETKSTIFGPRSAQILACVTSQYYEALYHGSPVWFNSLLKKHRLINDWCPLHVSEIECQRLANTFCNEYPWHSRESTSFCLCKLFSRIHHYKLCKLWRA